MSIFMNESLPMHVEDNFDQISDGQSNADR
jgi:hypothetical protein